ncbi:MAG: DUF86 domain-containing protein [Deltaproteobacteria bacterium]|nr:DUF86 domain-containing protein [Deltaproteobacteria bacterium]
MYDKSLVIETLKQILSASQRIEKRFDSIQSPDDFLSSDEKTDKLDAICMMLIAIGETPKKIDRISDGQLFLKYPQIDWKGLKGIRDIISHQYFDLDVTAVYETCKTDIPAIMKVVSQMIRGLE